MQAFKSTATLELERALLVTFINACNVKEQSMPNAFSKKEPVLSSPS